LAQYDGELTLNRIGEISDETAEALAKHRGGILSLYGLRKLSAKAASSLMYHVRPLLVHPEVYAYMEHSWREQKRKSNCKSS
jgi:hypothetical protein